MDEHWAGHAQRILLTLKAIQSFPVTTLHAISDLLLQFLVTNASASVNRAGGI
jgi:hypothetical protein